MHSQTFSNTQWYIPQQPVQPSGIFVASPIGRCYKAPGETLPLKPPSTASFIPSGMRCITIWQHQLIIASTYGSDKKISDNFSYINNNLCDQRRALDHTLYDLHESGCGRVILASPKWDVVPTIQTMNKLLNNVLVNFSDPIPGCRWIVSQLVIEFRRKSASLVNRLTKVETEKTTQSTQHPIPKRINEENESGDESCDETPVSSKKKQKGEELQHFFVNVNKILRTSYRRIIFTPTPCRTNNWSLRSWQLPHLYSFLRCQFDSTTRKSKPIQLSKNNSALILKNRKIIQNTMFNRTTSP